MTSAEGSDAEVDADEWANTPAARSGRRSNPTASRSTEAVEPEAVPMYLGDSGDEADGDAEDRVVRLKAPAATGSRYVNADPNGRPRACRRT